MCEVVRRAIGRVYVSQSQCIFANLAFEEHIFRTHDLENDGDVMIVWSNRPSVVVGRHQNPWTEVNIPFVKEFGIDLARRHSGGGTVYHDQGNVNISIVTSQKDHCRPRNLRFLSEALNRELKVNIIPNSRDDMEMHPGTRKCSGTAARLARERSYHHLTLLVDVDLQILKTALRSPYKNFITTNATQSVRAPAVGFLRQDDENANVKKVTTVLIDSFANKFEKCDVITVNPDNEIASNHPVSVTYAELRDSKWLYGKTPKFTWQRGNQKILVENGIVRESTNRSFLNEYFDPSGFL